MPDVKALLSQHFRASRNTRLRAVIERTARKNATLRVLDLGGRAEYWREVGLDFLRDNRVCIDILNVSPEEHGCLEDSDSGMFRYMVGNACALDMPDDSYDLCHSNSVIEHVGLADSMERFAREVRRIAPAYYVQSPNFWFPVDPHFWRFPFLHWLPRPIRARMMVLLPLATAGRARNIGEGYIFADSSQMLSRSHMRHLFPDAGLIAERVFGLLAKSYTAVRTGEGKPNA